MLEAELEQESEEHWIAVSDLMSGLMMLFLLIAVMYLVIVERKNDEIERVVVPYEDLREELFADKLDQFRVYFREKCPYDFDVGALNAFSIIGDIIRYESRHPSATAHRYGYSQHI